ncbi:MAG: hypothetical protein D6725_12365 [Planctomycetota bacterium]|nr:MAG: hypothetical protein D6725_12365 [Planctomycetota bacterium]
MAGRDGAQPNRDRPKPADRGAATDLQSRSEATTQIAAKVREPVALAAAEPLLYVANRSSGSLSVIDLRAGVAVAEHAVGRRPVDLQWLVPGRLLVMADELDHSVIVLQTSDDSVDRIARISVAPYPQSVCVLPATNRRGRRRVTAAGLWSRTLTVVDIDIDSADHTRAPGTPTRVSTEATRRAEGARNARSVSIRATRHVRLPFPAREQCALADGRHVLVAGAFAAALAMVDVETGRVKGHWIVPGHNIRGMVLSADRRSVLLAQQMLNPTIETEKSRIFWGGVIGNVVRTVALSELGIATDGTNAKTSSSDRQPDARASRGTAHDRPADDVQARATVAHGMSNPRRIGRWTLYPLGEPKNAAGDPGHMAITPEGRMLICLTGVGELGRQDTEFDPLKRLPVGDGPVDVVVTQAGDRAYVANRFSDSVSVIDLKEFRVENRIELGPKPVLTAVQRGERLFYNARLSLDGWYSCHSCHSDGHTNGFPNDNASDATFGTPKKIPSLLGTAHTAPWGWFGNRPTLEDQVRQSIRSTMAGRDGPFDRPEVAADIAAYLRSLPPIPSAAAAGLLAQPDTELLARGRRIFHEIGCADCHAPPSYTTDAVYDVGLKDEFGVREFNPPSLLGVREKAPYFHDQSAATLEEVLRRHPAGPATPDGRPPAARLSDADRRALVAFLKSL